MTALGLPVEPDENRIEAGHSLVDLSIGTGNLTSSDKHCCKKDSKLTIGWPNVVVLIGSKSSITSRAFTVPSSSATLAEMSRLSFEQMMKDDLESLT